MPDAFSPVISFRCYFPGGSYTTHRIVMPLSDIPTWITAYYFTHPGCSSITVKIWRSENND